MNELSISKQYPTNKYNLLGNTNIMVTIPDIKSPVIQVISLKTDPKDGEVYIQQKASGEWTDKKGNYHPATPNLYAITKNGLGRLADGAGITTLSSEHVIPTTCQKCVAVNQNSGRMVQCGNCKNKDVAYRVTISVPQLTGENLIVEDTHEIIVDNVTPGMTEKQRSEFMKHLPQICEAKALNGAIRTALHIKGTYTLEEIQKPFVVAYLVPNLDHQEVKKAAIENMFLASSRLFRMAPSVQQVESKVPSQAAIEAADGENYDEYVDDTYMQNETIIEAAEQAAGAPEHAEDRTEDFCCDKCGIVIPKNVWDYSYENYGRPLCYKCQRIVKNGQRGRQR